MTTESKTRTYSTLGRPRALTDAQIQAILHWHRNRRTFKQVAREYRLSPNTIKRIVDTQGDYKQISPERRPDAKAERRRRIADLKAKYLY